MNTIQPVIAVAPLVAGLGALLTTLLGGVAVWIVTKLADFFTTKAVALALVMGLIGFVLVIPVTIWAVAETFGISMGILTTDPFAGAPGMIPWVIGLIDDFIPLKFCLTVAVVTVLMKFAAANIVVLVAAVSKIISSRT